MNTRKKVYKMSIGNQGKLGKNQGKVRDFRVKNLADTLKHRKMKNGNIV